MRRHRLDRSAGSVLDAVDAVGALHSSDPCTPYLACWARIPRFALSDLDDALYTERSLWRLHAMRRTLWVVRRADVAMFAAGAGDVVALKERGRLLTWLAEAGLTSPDSKLSDVAEMIAEELVSGPLSTSELGERIPWLREKIVVGGGRYTQEVPIGSRLLYQLAMEGLIVRTEPAGTWRSSQYRWALTRQWFGEDPGALSPEEGRDRLLEKYLRSFGPATTTDIRWWSGWTARDTGRSLDRIEAEPVLLDDDQQAYVLPGDTTVEEVETPVVAMLFGLDPTTMGWKERDWYIDPSHVATLFDRNGNAGRTISVDGRMVGGWGQNAEGEVVYRLLENVGPAEELIRTEGAALTSWLEGVVATPRFPSPLDRELASG